MEVRQFKSIIEETTKISKEIDSSKVNVSLTKYNTLAKTDN
jgi:hypothetical protein